MSSSWVHADAETRPFLIGATVVLGIFIPLWFFRYARAAWIFLDLVCDPPKESEAPTL